MDSRKDAATPFLLGAIDLGTLVVLAAEGKLDAVRYTGILTGTLAGAISVGAYFLRPRARGLDAVFRLIKIIFSPFCILFFPAVPPEFRPSFLTLDFALCYFMGGGVCWLFGVALDARLQRG